MTVSRRGFLAGLAGFVACAPSIVRASSLMQISEIVAPTQGVIIVGDWTGYTGAFNQSELTRALVDSTRRAFIPSVMVDIYKTDSFLAQLVADAKDTGKARKVIYDPYCPKDKVFLMDEEPEYDW